MWFMYDMLLLPLYMPSGQKDSFLIALLPASILGSISRRLRLSLLCSSCSRQMAMAESRAKATTRLGCPRAQAFNRKSFNISRVAGLRREVNFGRSPESSTRWKQQRSYLLDFLGLEDSAVFHVVQRWTCWIQIF